MKLEAGFSFACMSAMAGSFAAEALPEALVDPIPAKIEKGEISVIAQEFRPGRPDPTPIEIINQQTAEITQREIDYHLCGKRYCPRCSIC